MTTTVPWRQSHAAVTMMLLTALFGTPGWSETWDSKADLSSTQGGHDWWYLYWDSKDQQCHPMTWGNKDAQSGSGGPLTSWWYAPVGTNAWCAIEIDQMHPEQASPRNPGSRELHPVRAWVAPRAMTIAVSFSVVDLEGVFASPSTDGIEASVYLNTTQLWTQHVPYQTLTPITRDLDISVAPGDRLQFTTAPGEYDEADHFTFHVGIREVAPPPEPVPSPPEKARLSTTFSLLRNGEPVPGATTKDLALEENADETEWRAARILDLKESQEKDARRRVMLAIDCSGSMYAPVKAGSKQIERLQAAKQAAVGLLGKFRPDDQIGLVTFSDKAQVLRTLGPPDAELRKSIMGVTLGTSTAYYDALLLAIRELASKTERGQPRGIIVLTDGRDTDSKATADDVVREAKAQAIPVFTCGLGLPDALAGNLTELAEATGGKYEGARTLDDIAKAFESAFKLLSVTYTATWESNVPPGTEAMLRFTSRGGQHGDMPVEQTIKVPGH